MSAPIRVGTRGSALAMAQARLAADALESAGARAELVIIQTAGDRRAPDTAWGEGAFVGALEDALLRGEVDVAVHSAKDMPTHEDARLQVAAYLPRADARDALVVAAGSPTATLATLPAGAVIGTDSPRRTGFVRARRPDVRVQPLHGNVDTRLRRLDAGEVDALVLACAGLDRLGRHDRISQRFDADELPPAPGQGAIALQVRSDDARLVELCERADDPTTRLAVEAERAFLAATGGGCRAPVGALATVSDDTLTLLGGFATLDGQAHALEQSEAQGADALAMAHELARTLVARRAALGGRGRVLVTRTTEQSARLVARLAEHGLSVVVVPTIEIQPLDDESSLAAALQRLAESRWAVVTSANGARAAAAAAVRSGVHLAAASWAAVGRQTATALGLPPEAAGGVWLPSAARAEVLAEELPIEPGDEVLLVRGSLADDALPARLADRGARVTEVIAYRTVEAPPGSRPLLERAVADGPLDAVLLFSPSALRGLLELATPGEQSLLRSLPAICVGPRTALAAREEGFNHVIESTAADASALAETTAEALRSSSVGAAS